MTNSYKKELISNDQESKTPGTVKLLLVDDSVVSRRALKTMLKGYKVQFHDASSGYEAIEAMNVIKDFDMVTMDYNMPGINGMETFQKLKTTKFLS